MAEINVAEHIEQIELNIMSGLKDFQRATVNRIEDLYRAGQMPYWFFRLSVLGPKR